MRKFLRVIAWFAIGITTLSICFHLVIFFKDKLFNPENWSELGSLLISEYFLWWYLFYAVTIVLWYLGKEKVKPAKDE